MSIVGSYMCKYGEIQVCDISAVFLDKFGVLFEEMIHGSWQEDGKIACQTLGTLNDAEESIPVTIRWENGARASGNITFLVLKHHKNALRAIFVKKNLHAKDQNCNGQRLFTCSLDAFMDWSKKAVYS